MQRPPQVAARSMRNEVEAFVCAHFRLAGTLRLHRGAIGWDLLRAPVNVALAPVFLSVKLAGLLLRLIGLRRPGYWLGARRILLKTSVARAVEEHITTELLGGAVPSSRSLVLLDDFTGIRSAVAEITTSMLVLGTGLALFGTATPGIVTMAPNVSGAFVHAAAVANFPLGSRLGGLWYDVFDIAQPVWFVAATGIVLALVASVVTTFAGIVADPLQAHLGIHRRRLLRLLDRIAEAEGKASGIAPEHVLARIADMADAGFGLVRLFRP